MDVWEWKKEGGWLCIKEADSISSHLNGDATKKNGGKQWWKVLDILFSWALENPKSCLFFKSLFETITVAKLWTLEVWFAKLFILKGFYEANIPSSGFRGTRWTQCRKREPEYKFLGIKKKKKKCSFQSTHLFVSAILFRAEIASVVTLFTCCYHSLTFHHWRHSVHPLLIYRIDDLQHPGWKLFFLILMRSLPCYIQTSSKFQLSSVDVLRKLVQQQLKEQTDHREPNTFWFENKTKKILVLQ